MIGIKSIASYVPANGVDNYAQGAKFSKDEDFILGKIGSAFLPRKDADQETSDLCVEAVNALFANNPQLKRESIDALIVVTQNGDAEGLPHTAAIVQDKLGLPTHVAAFDISLGCSGYVYGIYAMKGFMEAAGLKNGLLVTADPYSKIAAPYGLLWPLRPGAAASTDSARLLVPALPPPASRPSPPVLAFGLHAMRPDPPCARRLWVQPPPWLPHRAPAQLQPSGSTRLHHQRLPLRRLARSSCRRWARPVRLAPLAPPIGAAGGQRRLGSPSSASSS